MKSEIQALLHVWSDHSIQFKLKTVSKNQKIYEPIAHSLMNVVMKRQEGQSKTNMKNLIAKNRKVIDGNRKSGNSLESLLIISWRWMLSTYFL